MIGHFLGTLTAEQEDRVLTGTLAPGWYSSPCLVGRALDIRHGCWQEPSEYTSGGARSWPFVEGAEAKSSVEDQFDDLCKRFGAPRVNAAIRSRILANRARRILSSGEPSLQEIT